MDWEDARDFIQALHDEYVQRLSDGEDEATAMESTVEGIAAPSDIFKLLWGAGALDAALEAAREDIEQAIVTG